MNIKRFIAVSTAVATIAGTALPALAEGPDFERHGPKDQSIKERILEKTAQIRDRLLRRREDNEERKQEHADRLSERLQEKLNAFWERAARRMARLIDRLRSIADRVDEKLDRFEAAGKDVTVQREKLAAAREAMDDAQTTLENATGQVEGILADNEPREAFRQLRALHKEVMGSIRTAHRALIDAIKSIRGLSDVDRGDDDEEVEGSPSPTPEPSESPSPSPTPSESPTPTPTP